MLTVYIKYNINRIYALIVVSIFIFVSTTITQVKAQEDKKEQIKIGYLNHYSIYVDPLTKVMSGYGYDFLVEIAKYAGWEYEFVEVEWSEGINMLASGELDLFGPIQKNAQREEIFDYPDHNIGFEYGALYTHKDNKEFSYNDFESFDGIRVGTQKNNFYNSRMDAYCKKHNINVEYVYTDSTKYYEELENGTIDAFLSGSLMDIPNTNVIAKISAEPYYYATTKGKTHILSEMNSAMESILSEDVYFAAKLDNKYYDQKSINTPAFTKAEKKYIEDNPNLTVVADPNWQPVQYWDNSYSKYKGIVIDLVSEISNISGLNFEYIYTDSYTESIAKMKTEKSDLLLGYRQSLDNLNLTYTNPILDLPVSLISNKTVDLTKNQSVAVLNLDNISLDIIKEMYPNFTFVNYEDSQSVVEALQNGDEELAIINTYTLDELVRKKPTIKYITIPIALKIPLSIGVSDLVDPIVISILNKSISMISAEEASSIIFANTVNRAYSFTFGTIIQKYYPLIIAILILFFGTILLILKRNQDRLTQIAYVDKLTGLATMEKFKLDLQSILKDANPSEYMIVSTDIDNFKLINDSFGYDVGNLTLLAITEHFLENLSSNELLARNNADNFLFFTKKLNHDELHARQTLMNDVDSHIRGILPDHYKISFSAGAYYIDNPAEDLSIMLDKANYARKSVKDTTSSTIAVYTSEINDVVEWRKQVALSMKLALINKEFEVYLQPKYLLKTEQLIGAEALVRWNHPTKGFLLPLKFIPIFENNGFITAVDLYVFEEICSTLQRWKQKLGAIPPITVSVNLSRLHLNNTNLVKDLVQIANKYDVDPSCLEIELTENIVIQSVDDLITIMKDLKDSGFNISIDDFGSGYSSLNILKDLPVDILKIDKVFLNEICETVNGQIIINSVTQMAQQLNITTVAEGVETKDQVDLLIKMGCDIAQGYYYSKPISIPEFEKIIGV